MSDQIGAWHEAPVTAVEAVGAVVSHHEVIAGRDDEILSLDVAGEVNGPGGEDVASLIGGDGREVVVVGVVVGCGRLSGVGLLQRNAIAINDAVAKVDAIAWKPDDSFDKDVMLSLSVGRGAEEDDGLVVLELAIGKKGRDWRRRRKGDALDKDMVANQQRARHGRGWDGEVLEEEGHDEEGDGESRADRGELVQRGTVAIFFREYLHRGSPKLEGSESSLLSGEELADAFFSVVEHFVELGSAVGVLLSGGLGLDEAA